MSKNAIHWTGGIILACLFLVFIFMVTHLAVASSHETNMTRRTALEVCKSIKDEPTRALCINQNNK